MSQRFGDNKMRVRAFSGKVDAFFFPARDEQALRVFRRVLSVGVFVFALSLIPDLRALFSDQGYVTRDQVRGAGAWSLLFLNGSLVWTVAVWSMLPVCCALLWLERAPRIAALVIWAVLWSFSQRFPFGLAGGFSLFAWSAFCFAFVPKAGPMASMRFLQIQCWAIMVSAVLYKYADSTWMDGSALLSILHYQQSIWNLSPILRYNWLVTAMTYGVTALEIFFCVGVLFEWTRRVALVALFGLLAGISFTLNTCFFVEAYAIAALSFLRGSDYSALAAFLHRKS